MNHQLTLNLNDLQDGEIRQIKETLSPSIMEIEEQELMFDNPIEIQGSCYISSNHLIIQLKIETKAKVPCSICNDFFYFPILLKHATIDQDLKKVKGMRFNYGYALRETILIELPSFFECHEGKCPERTKLNKFLQHSSETKEKDSIQFPFEHLDETFNS